MKLLLAYLRPHWKLVLLALLLATINQVFSLLDPLIFRHVIDEYATKFDQYTTREFLRGVSLLLLAAVGVAFVSRVAKNFQDYFLNVVTQRVGARLYADGIRHSLELPYQLFEDQRSGETLGKLQKLRTDVEKLMAVSINVVFQTLVGVAEHPVQLTRVRDRAGLNPDVVLGAGPVPDGWPHAVGLHGELVAARRCARSLRCA